jgi:hypothetical protein
MRTLSNVSLDVHYQIDFTAKEFATKMARDSRKNKVRLQHVLL